MQLLNESDNPIYPMSIQGWSFQVKIRWWRHKIAKCQFYHVKVVWMSSESRQSGSDRIIFETRLFSSLSKTTPCAPLQNILLFTFKFPSKALTKSATCFFVVEPPILVLHHLSNRSLGLSTRGKTTRRPHTSFPCFCRAPIQHQTFATPKKIT